MKYEIYEGLHGRHYAVVKEDIAKEEARCFIANKWKVAKTKLKITHGWLAGNDTLHFRKKKGAEWERVWVITRMSSLPKSYLK